MKKIMSIAITIMLIGILCGCGSLTTVEKINEQVDTKSMFVLVEKSLDWQVVYHRETKVMYAVSDGSYTYGNFTLLVNADGTPMLYDAE